MDHAPPKKPIPGANISFAPNRSRASWTRLGPQLTSIFFIRFQDPAGKIRALQNEPVPCGTNQGHGTDQGPAIRIRTPQYESGPNGTDQVQTDQGPADQSRIPQDGLGPAGQSRTPHDESGPRWTNQGAAGRIRASQDESGPRRTYQDPARSRDRQGLTPTRPF